MKNHVILPNGLTMAEIGPSKHTRPERVVRMWLVRNGYRHAVQRKVGRYTVDLVVEQAPWNCLAIEVHGRFWHCPRTSGMLLMSKHWRDKLGRNVERDERKRKFLLSMGYSIFTVWDDELKDAWWKAALSRALGPPAASSAEARSSRTRSSRGRFRASESRSRPGRTAHV